MTGRHHRPPRGQPALGDDHDQRTKPEDPGQLDVIELDAKARLADGDADRQVDQQARQASPGRQSHRDHRYQQHRRTDQQGDIKRAVHAWPIAGRTRRFTTSTVAAASGEDLVAAGHTDAESDVAPAQPQACAVAAQRRLRGPSIDRRGRHRDDRSGTGRSS